MLTEGGSNVLGGLLRLLSDCLVLLSDDHTSSSTSGGSLGAKQTVEDGLVVGNDGWAVSASSRSGSGWLWLWCRDWLLDGSIGDV